MLAYQGKRLCTCSVHSYRLLCFKKLVSKAHPWIFRGWLGGWILTVDPLSKISPGFMLWSMELQTILKYNFYFSESAFQKFACMSVYKCFVCLLLKIWSMFFFFSDVIFDSIVLFYVIHHIVLLKLCWKSSWNQDIYILTMTWNTKKLWVSVCICEILVIGKEFPNHTALRVLFLASFKNATF